MFGPETLVALCQEQARVLGSRPAIDDGQVALTYRELDGRSRAAAGLLRRHGVSPGDRVLLVGRNSTAWVVMAFGILYAGGSIVPLSHASPQELQAEAVGRLTPRLVVADDHTWLVHDATPVVRMTADLTGIAVTEAERVDPDAVALVMSTSGTTGKAKFGPMSHRQLVQLYSEVSRRLGLSEHDRLLGVVPLAHSFGFNGVLVTAFSAGSMVRLVPRYSSADLADLIVEERLSVLAGPPTLYHDLTSQERSSMALGVRLAVTGSTEVAADQVRHMCDVLGIPEIIVGYGMTETCGTVALGNVPARTGSSQTPMLPVSGNDVRILDWQGTTARAGEIGRVMVRGDNVLTGYVGSRDALPIEEGWLDTGDLGRLDGEGRVIVAARSKDTVIVSGFNVFPPEVERTLSLHPDVEGVIVIGVPDERRGQRLVACVVPVPGADLNVEDIVNHARTHLAPFQIPEEFLQLEVLPTTANGKVSREAMRRRLAT